MAVDAFEPHAMALEAFPSDEGRSDPYRPYPALRSRLPAHCSAVSTALESDSTPGLQGVTRKPEALPRRSQKDTLCTHLPECGQS